MNALVTVHQLAEDLPFCWLDTPFELPFPRNNPSPLPSGPNFGFIVIPSDIFLNGEDPLTPYDNSFTTYRLQSNLSIVGDMYGTKECDIQSFAMKPFIKRTEVLSPRLTPMDADLESEEEWTSFQSNWKVDLSQISKEVLSIHEPVDSNERMTRRKLLNETIAGIAESDAGFETM
jgi:hypothetical protein